MEIVSLQLSGFKNYEKSTQLNFKDEHNNYIFDADAEKKIQIFESILGIIFGFATEEKKRFRGDTEINKTYTGLITLELDERTMMIERDFETDFVACLISDKKTTRPIFQGKDLVDNGYSRPYLDMLKSVFPIIDKEIFREVCYTKAVDETLKLSSMLETLYLLLTPQFKFSSTKMLVNETNKIIHRIDDAKLDNHALNKLEFTKSGIEHLIMIEKAILHLQREQDKINLLIERIKSRKEKADNSYEALDGKFSDIKELNPLQLRADILLWKSLKQIKEDKETELASVITQKNQIKNILENDLLSYSKLPDNFNQKVSRFKEIQSKLKKRERNLESLQKSIHLSEDKLERSKRINRFLLIGLPPFSFLIVLFIFGMNMAIIIPAVVLFTALVLGIVSRFNFRLQSKIYSLQEDSHILQKRINGSKEEIADLEESSRIFSNPDHIDKHLERYQKYLKYNTELKRLEKQEIRINELLESKSYAKQLPAYEKRYHGIVEIDRPDLENFLDEFVQLKNQILSSETHETENPVTEEILLLSSNYENAINELRNAKARLSSELKVEDEYENLQVALDQIDRKIKNFHLHYRYKESY